MQRGERSVYHIAYPYTEGYGEDSYGAIRVLPTDTLEGVYTNMVEHDQSPSGVRVFFGYEVALDIAKFDALYEARRQRSDAHYKELRREQYLRLKDEFGGDDGEG